MKKYNVFISKKRNLTGPKFSESYEDVCKELTSLSERLLKLLPDPSIGPEERLERLSRIIPHSVQKTQLHLTARTKLNNLRSRLDELLPEHDGSYLEKIEFLISLVNTSVRKRDLSFFQKLEKLGDNRISDCGR